MTAPFVSASWAPANVTRCDADLPRRPGCFGRDIGHGLRAEPGDGVSTVLVPEASGLGITLDGAVVALQRDARRW